MARLYKYSMKRLHIIIKIVSLPPNSEYDLQAYFVEIER